MRAVALVLSLSAALLAAGCVSQPLSSQGLPDAGAALAENLPYPPVQELRASIHESLETGEPVTVKAYPVIDQLAFFTGLGPAREFKVNLKPSTLVSADTWAEVDGERVPFPAVDAYEGEVVDRPGWLARVVVTDQWARGVILGTQFNAVGVLPFGPEPFLIRMGLDGNLPHGTRLAEDSESSAASSIPLAPTGMRFDREDWPEQDCLELVPPHVTPVIGRPADVSELRARLVLDADAAFHEALGDDAFPIMVAMLHEMEPIYAQEVGIRFDLVGLHVNTDPDYYPNPEDEAPLAALAGYWNERDDVERDVVHLITGKRSSYAMANCIGGAGIPELGYTFTPLNWELYSTFFHTSAFAHELGHIFSAHHHYGNHLETEGGLATIMIQGYTPGYRPVFSTLSKTAIRGWAEAYLSTGQAAA